MTVLLSKRAQQAIARIDDRWRRHAMHPDVFFDELQVAIERLGATRPPDPGTPCAMGARVHLRRYLLERSRYHVYFEIDEHAQIVRVLTVWSAQRPLPTL